MRLKNLLEMLQLIDFNFQQANSNIQSILKKLDITDFDLVDRQLNLYRGNSENNELWFIIF